MRNGPTDATVGVTGKAKHRFPMPERREAAAAAEEAERGEEAVEKTIGIRGEEITALGHGGQEATAEGWEGEGEEAEAAGEEVSVRGEDEGEGNGSALVSRALGARVDREIAGAALDRAAHEAGEERAEAGGRGDGVLGREEQALGGVPQSGGTPVAAAVIFGEMNSIRWRLIDAMKERRQALSQCLRRRHVPPAEVVWHQARGGIGTDLGAGRRKKPPYLLLFLLLH